MGATRPIVAQSQESIAGLHSIQHIRPQSLVAVPAHEPDLKSVEQLPLPRPNQPPILALLDGVPIAAHPLLDGRLSVQDMFSLDETTLSKHRVHGTAMASLITLGDRNLPGLPLPRRIFVIPVMSGNETGEHLPADQIIVDIIYQALFQMLGDTDPSAPDVLIVNLSLGNEQAPFHGQMSAWARLLDWLAWEYGLLFVVSAGNARGPFDLPAYKTMTELEASAPEERKENILRAIDALKAERRIISPAETMNGVTVGAYNRDAVPPKDFYKSASNIDPYPGLTMTNPSSRLGPGFANSIKPDIIFPGAREHLKYAGTKKVVPAPPNRAFGLKVAAPPVSGNTAQEGYTNATSAATALASRTCHRIYDALASAYGINFTSLPRRHRAVLLKALLVHPAKWPQEAADLIRDIVGPSDPKQHVKQKDNIRRFFGYGAVDARGHRNLPRGSSAPCNPRAQPCFRVTNAKTQIS